VSGLVTQDWNTIDTGEGNLLKKPECEYPDRRELKSAEYQKASLGAEDRSPVFSHQHPPRIINFKDNKFVSLLKNLIKRIYNWKSLIFSSCLKSYLLP
jgi:hypothetical protein